MVFCCSSQPTLPILRRHIVTAGKKHFHPSEPKRYHWPPPSSTMTSSGVLGPEDFPAWARPFLPPPPSPEVLRHVHENRGPSILAAMVVFSILAIVAVIARLYARRMRKLPFQADDYLMVPALVRLVHQSFNGQICH